MTLVIGIVIGIPIGALLTVVGAAFFLNSQLEAADANREESEEVP